MTRPLRTIEKYFIIQSQEKSSVLESATNIRSMMKRPVAFLPLAMSLAALSTVLGSVAMFGVVHEADEGAAAHIFQLLIAAQIPVVAYFAIRYLPQAPKETLYVLGIQLGAALAAMAPVFFLHL
jgi:hypothetical protein